MVRNEKAPRGGAGDTSVIVDFHSHYTGRLWPAIMPPTSDVAAQAQWHTISATMSDLGGLLADMDKHGVDHRVLSVPPYLVASDGPIAPGLLPSINEYLAETVAAYPERLSALASVDIFRGEQSARDIDRAIDGLGLPGIVVDCASDGLLLDAPSARPGLEAAAERRIPVFMHPVSLPSLNDALPGLGEYTETLARGTSAAASMLALIHGGVFDSLPGLRVVVPWLGGCGLVLAGTHEVTDRLRTGTPESDRWHIYVDTMGFEPHALRYAVDLLGADHVLVGSDWPVAPQALSRDQVDAAFTVAGLEPSERHNVAAANALALLGRTAPKITREVRDR